MIWIWVALWFAIGAGFVLGAWWNSQPRNWEGDE